MTTAPRESTPLAMLFLIPLILLLKTVPRTYTGFPGETSELRD